MSTEPINSKAYSYATTMADASGLRRKTAMWDAIWQKYYNEWIDKNGDK